MNGPAVSVIIPTYNCAEYIAQTLEGILSQTLQDIEVIVVDDGSTDHTQAIVARYAPRVRLVAQQNAGVCVARNRGIREAQGRFICLIDHDDYWFPDKLASQVEAMEKYPDSGVIYTDFTLWFPKDGHFPDPQSLFKAIPTHLIDPDYSGWIYHQLLLDCWVLTSTAMFRAEVFRNCGGFDETLPYSEDWELWLRVSRQYPFTKLTYASTLYRQHPHQGNRKVRDVDYRTRLLTQARNQWGLCSQDNRCISASVFRKKLAAYHADFGLYHLKAGHRTTATQALIKAWLTNPLHLKYPCYLAAGWAGWKPKW